MFYTVTLNPALDVFIDAPGFRPGAVNFASGFYRVSGGKGLNVARVLKSLGAPCTALGIACGGAGDSRFWGFRNWASPPISCAGGETRTNIKITDRNTGLRRTSTSPARKSPKARWTSCFPAFWGAFGPGIPSPFAAAFQRRSGRNLR